MKRIKVWQCEFCKKILLSMSGAYKHERLGCYSNPKTKSCRTCINLTCNLGDEGTRTTWACLEKEANPFRTEIRGCHKYEHGENAFNEDE
jgi:hypothetical protein